MITAHLPSGYVLACAGRQSDPLIVGACVLGAVFPDFDLIWFFFVDDRAFHHHRYWVHAPGFWAMVAVPVSCIAIFLKARLRRVVAWFMAAWMLHLCLDTIVGDIMWQWPFSDRLFHLATVTPTDHHYVVTFMLHWSFLIEIAIWILAITLFLKRKSNV